MTFLLVAAVLLVVTTLIVNAIQRVSATRRVLGKASGTNPGDATGAVLMASDYGGVWHSPDSGGSPDGSWDASDCGSGMDADGGGSDCGGGGDGGGGGGSD